MFTLIAQVPELEELRQEIPIVPGNVTIPIGQSVSKLVPTLSFDLGLIITRAAQLGLMLAALFTFGLLVVGGVQWILSAGDKGKVEQARATITNAVIGLAITASAFAIFSVIRYFFGLQGIEIK